MKKYLLSGLSALAFFTSFTLAAQTPYDAIMMKRKEFCFALTYEQGSWDHYWEGTYLRTNQTVATVSRRIVMPMLAIGISDKLNLIVAVPYVKTKSSEPNGGKFQGAQGFQDLTIALKYEILNKQVEKGKLYTFGTHYF